MSTFMIVGTREEHGNSSFEVGGTRGMLPARTSTRGGGILLEAVEWDAKQIALVRSCVPWKEGMSGATMLNTTPKKVPREDLVFML